MFAHPRGLLPLKTMRKFAFYIEFVVDPPGGCWSHAPVPDESCPRCTPNPPPYSLSGQEPPSPETNWRRPPPPEPTRRRVPLGDQSMASTPQSPVANLACQCEVVCTTREGPQKQNRMFLKNIGSAKTDAAYRRDLQGQIIVLIR